MRIFWPMIFRILNKGFKCPYCDYKCEDRKSTIAHIKEKVKKNNYKCLIKDCTRDFSKSDKGRARAVVTHYLFNHTQRYPKCPLCPKRCVGIKNLKGHISGFHKRNSRDLVLCEICCKSSLTAKQNKHHMVKHTMIGCDKIFEGESEEKNERKEMLEKDQEFHSLDNEKDDSDDSDKSDINEQLYAEQRENKKKRNRNYKEKYAKNPKRLRDQVDWESLSIEEKRVIKHKEFVERKRRNRRIKRSKLMQKIPGSISKRNLLRDESEKICSLCSAVLYGQLEMNHHMTEAHNTYHTSYKWTKKSNENTCMTGNLNKDSSYNQDAIKNNGKEKDQCPTGADLSGYGYGFRSDFSNFQNYDSGTPSQLPETTQTDKETYWQSDSFYNSDFTNNFEQDFPSKDTRNNKIQGTKPNMEPNIKNNLGINFESNPFNRASTFKSNSQVNAPSFDERYGHGNSSYPSKGNSGCQDSYNVMKNYNYSAPYPKPSYFNQGFGPLNAPSYNERYGQGGSSYNHNIYPGGQPSSDNNFKQNYPQSQSYNNRGNW